MISKQRHLNLFMTFAICQQLPSLLRGDPKLKLACLGHFAEAKRRTGITVIGQMIMRGRCDALS